MRNLLTALCTLLLFPLLLSAQDGVSYGGASMYADAYHGRPTASGEPYDKNKLTGAHKTLPFGTIVKVTRLDNKKSVEIRINDRGPFIKGRIIDLSRKAAERLGLSLKEGVVEVKVEVTGKGSGSEAVAKTTPKVEAPVSAATTKPKTETVPEEFSARSPLPVKEKPTLVEAVDKMPKEKVNEKPKPTVPAKPKSTVEKETKPATTVTAAKPESTGSGKVKLVTDKNFKTYDLYKVEMVRPERKGFGVQVATFTEYENVMRKVAELQGKWFKNILVSVEQGSANDSVYKIILGPFDDRTSADNYKTALKKNKKIDGFVVPLENE